jgi:NADPH:quinone reductase-like Zn-dependent oxidoreductase
MRALVAAPSAPGGIELREVQEPDPAPNEAVVEVGASSLNRGECSALQGAKHGWRPGWDVAGVIVEPAAAQHRSPEVGTRVFGWANGGGWAERVAVRSDHLATLPEQVSFEVASTLPVAGLTAMGAVAFVDPLEGRRVAITGAAGGVGRFAVQLAHDVHADVTAIVGSPERGEGLLELGADHVVLALEPEGEPFDLIMESAGGSSLAAALSRVSADGTVVSFGNSSNEPTTFDARGFYRRGRPTLRGYFVTRELLEGRLGTAELARLVELVSTARLRVEVGLAVPWTDAASAVTALLERRVRGKAVLTVGSS